MCEATVHFQKGTDNEIHVAGAAGVIFSSLVFKRWEIPMKSAPSARKCLCFCACFSRLFPCQVEDLIFFVFIFLPPSPFISFRSFLEIDLRHDTQLHLRLFPFSFNQVHSNLLKSEKKEKSQAQKDVCRDKGGCDWSLNPNLLNRNPLLRP